MTEDAGSENVECTRCGNQWYSEKFKTENIVPGHCPKCYQRSVRKIPEPPTRIEKIEVKIVKNIHQIPGKISDTKDLITDFKEKNRGLLGLVYTGIGIALVTLILVYVTFYF